MVSAVLNTKDTQIPFVHNVQHTDDSTFKVSRGILNFRNQSEVHFLLDFLNWFSTID